MGLVPNVLGFRELLAVRDAKTSNPQTDADVAGKGLVKGVVCLCPSRNISSMFLEYCGIHLKTHVRRMGIVLLSSCDRRCSANSLTIFFPVKDFPVPWELVSMNKGKVNGRVELEHTWRALNA